MKAIWWLPQEMRMGETEDNQEVQISNYEINSGDLCTWS